MNEADIAFVNTYFSDLTEAPRVIRTRPLLFVRDVAKVDFRLLLKAIESSDLNVLLGPWPEVPVFSEKSNSEEESFSDWSNPEHLDELINRLQRNRYKIGVDCSIPDGELKLRFGDHSTSKGEEEFWREVEKVLTIHPIALIPFCERRLFIFANNRLLQHLGQAINSVNSQ